MKSYVRKQMEKQLKKKTKYKRAEIQKRRRRRIVMENNKLRKL